MNIDNNYIAMMMTLAKLSKASDVLSKGQILISRYIGLNLRYGK